MTFDTTQGATLEAPPSEFLPRITQTPSNGNGMKDNAKTDLLRVLQQIGPPLQPLAEKMLDYSKAELQAVVEARLGKKDQARLSKLIECNRERTLTEKENAEVQTLLDKSAAITMDSAAARWLLANG